MSVGMAALEPGLVDIVRDLMVAHRMSRRLFARYRQGDLGFDEVQELVGDNEGAVLYRLKERSHALFRVPHGGSQVAMRREALFDLTVGSLFHEAMKFRENFYQRSVYGPRVHALRSQAGPEAEDLFREFEKILEAASVRLDEALQESEALLSQTTAQLRVLLADHRRNGLVTRYLIRHAQLAEEVFEEDIDSLLAWLHQSAGAGYRLAARSYLESGCFAEALEAVDAAIERGAEDEQLLRLRDYADGMWAYQEARYADAVELLERWVDGELPAGESRFAELAQSALSRVPQLVDGDDADVVGKAARRLAERLAPGGVG